MGITVPGSKVFVVSLHRTMTRSTDILLSMLGYSTMHFPKFFQGQNLLEAVRGREDDPAFVLGRLAPVFESRDAFSDVPVPGLYRELAERWPDSRFVLVSRDPWGWARSVRGHMKNRRLSPFNWIQYRLYIPQTVQRVADLSEEELASIHERHTQEVTQYFHSYLGQPERLCHVDIRDGQVGEQISRFLGHNPRPLPRLTGRPSEEDLSVSQEWVASAPHKSDAHYFLAANLRYFCKEEEAEYHLRVATEVEPDQPKPYAELAELLGKQGRPIEAGEEAQAAIDYGLLRPALYKLAAQGEWSKGNLRRSARLWMAATRLRRQRRKQ